MGFFSVTRKKRTPAQVQARLKKRLEKKMKVAQAKAANASLRAKLAKLS